MIALLDPRLWGVFILAAALSFGGGYLKGSHDRGKHDELERLAAVSAANIDAFKKSEHLQENVDAATQSAAARERRILADAARARDDVRGLRDDLDAVERASAESLSTANKALARTSGLLATCSDRYLGMAEAAARADSEARELRQAWPK